MADLNSKLQQVKEGESFLEKMARIIPGYNGYVDRDNSREIDTILRNELARKLDENKVRTKNVVLNLSKHGKLFETDGVDKLEKKIDNATAKLRSASRGYSGAFDVSKVKEDKLNQLYSFDAMLFDTINEISATFELMENNSAANTDINETQQKAGKQLDDMLHKFDERENFLRNI
ncbi:MAG: hypothetical protein EHM58_06510 [Ignavibacteriae bacterium]|nr:MAG: hypothetical protein EHM58_06510 [Ignavibacteriota bacterium]